MLHAYYRHTIPLHQGLTTKLFVMEFYYVMMNRFDRLYCQLRYIFFFVLVLIPVLAATGLVRLYSVPLCQLLLLLEGWVTWTFVEYLLHRFPMHSKDSDSHMAKAHHHHHSHPTEMAIKPWHRLVMFVMLTVVFWIAFVLRNYFTLFAGIGAGVMGYVLMHWLLHQRLAQRLFKRLVRYHIYHHCKYPNTCFGISVTWWDDLFGTVPKNPMISQRIIDFYFGEKRGNSDDYDRH